MTLYEDLGIDNDADQDEIKKAFKDKSKTEHPDKGGTKERFQLIQHAYSVLKDDKKKDFYDKTGQEQRVEPFNAKFAGFVQQYLVPLLFQVKDEKYEDVKHGFDKIADQCIRECQENLLKLTSDNDSVIRIEAIVKRLKVKDGKPDLINNTLQQEAQIRRLKHDGEKAHWETELEFFTKAKEYLQHYTYDFEERTDEQKNQSRWVVENVNPNHGAYEFFKDFTKNH